MIIFRPGNNIFTRRYKVIYRQFNVWISGVSSPVQLHHRFIQTPKHFNKVIIEFKGWIHVNSGPFSFLPCDYQRTTEVFLF